MRIRLHREVAQRTVVRRLRPFPDALQLLGFRRGEKLARLRHRALQPRRADVVRAPFPKNRAELLRGLFALRRRSVGGLFAKSALTTRFGFAVIGQSGRGLPHSKLSREHFAHDQDVFENKLLLQIDRVRGDDRFFVLRLRPHHRRDEIRERFPDARARLDHEMLPLRERLRHRDRHLLLLRPILEALRLRQQPIRGKNLPDGLRKFRR